MALRSQAPERVELATFLDELEEAIERVRHGYEKYFAGVDRVPPIRQRESLERRVRHLESISTRSTVLRFRAGGLRARFVTYKHYWTRVELEIERGASRKDILRLRRGAPTPETIAREEKAAPVKHDNGELPDGIDPDHLRQVFKELLKAKKAAGETLDGLTFAALCRKLSREAPKLQQKHNCTTLRFEVAKDGGKVRLRSRPG